MAELARTLVLKGIEDFLRDLVKEENKPTFLF